MVLGAQPKNLGRSCLEKHSIAGQGRNGKIMRTWFFPKGEEPIDLVVRSPQPDLKLGKNGMGESSQTGAFFKLTFMVDE